MFLILTLIIIVAAFNIISGLTILIKNKTKEIAILRSLGLSQNLLRNLFPCWFFNWFLQRLLEQFWVLFFLFIEEIRQFYIYSFWFTNLS